jgi:GT2 family glycosyltransferase
VSVSPSSNISQTAHGQPLVWIIVLHYQGPEYTQACLNSLRKLHYQNFRVLLLDNGSPDHSAVGFAQTFPDYDHVRLEHNLGFAGGCNAGIKYCVERGAQWVWLLNNDTSIHPDSLTTLVEAAHRHPQAALLGAQVFTPDGNSFVPSGGGEIDFRKGKTYERKQPPADGSEMACDWISGCNLLVRVEAFQTVGGFDEKYFLYFEDTDLCCRVRQAGWQCLMVPAARIEHIGLRSTQGKTAMWRHYYYIRNRLLFFRRHSQGLRHYSITLAVTAHLARHTFVLPFRGEEGRRRLRAEWLGMRDYCLERFGKAECLDW